MAALTDQDRELHAGGAGAGGAGAGARYVRPLAPGGDWSTEAWERMKEELGRKIPVTPDTQYKVALFGPVQSGKSSLVNTFLSAYRDGRYVQVAHSAPAQLSSTRHLYCYELKLRSHAPDVLLCDTMGYEEGGEEDETLGPHLHDVKYILDGLLEDDYCFDENSVTLSEMKRHGDKDAQIKPRPVNVVAVVWEATYFSHAGVIKRLREVLRAAQHRRIVCCVLVTKVDKLSATIAQDLSQVFTDEKMEEVKIEVSEKLEIEAMNIFPVQNYTPQTNGSVGINCLALRTLLNILDLADITQERQHGLPDDHIPPLLSAPWKYTRRERRQDARHALENIATLNSRPDLYHINIAVIGLVGAGKSQFINAVLSASDGKSKTDAETGLTQHLPFTRHFRAYNCTPLNIRLFDTMGLSTATKEGIVKQDLISAVEGRLDVNTVFNTRSPCLERIPNPPLKARMHAVVLVLDAATFPSLSDDELGRLHITYQELKGMTRVPCIAVLSHLDRVCGHVEKSGARWVYWSDKVRESMAAVSNSALRIPVDDIIPLVIQAPSLPLTSNSPNPHPTPEPVDTEPEEETRYTQILQAMHHVCDRAKDCIARQPHPRPEPPTENQSIVPTSFLCAAFAIVAAMLYYFMQNI